MGERFYPIFPEITRCLYLDYAPHLELMEELASGDWRNNIQDGQLYNPGEVPWAAFNFGKTIEVVKEVDWRIEMKTNERDQLWKQFEERFQ